MQFCITNCQAVDNKCMLHKNKQFLSALIILVLAIKNTINMSFKYSSVNSSIYINKLIE